MLPVLANEKVRHATLESLAARAVKLFKGYGAKKTTTILWRFTKGKHVGSKEREAVKAFIGISAVQKACTCPWRR